jgi:hypothetical protein
MNRTIAMKIAVSVAAALLSLAALEAGVRVWGHMQAAQPSPQTAAELIRALPHGFIEGREIGNQMIVHNAAWFARHPAPAQVTSAYAGTSRTKVLRPQHFGIEGAVNGSGNSYNEISYGLLMQMEALRIQFPNLRTVHVEASLLLRQSARLRVAGDHYKYLPLLEALLPLRDALPGGQAFRAEVLAARKAGPKAPGRLALRAQRSSMRLANLFGAGGEKAIPVLQDEWMRDLLPNGERAAAAGPLRQRADWKPETTPDNAKVQRMRDIPGWKPWDGLFDLVALWGREHGIAIVLFQPPVRSDLYHFQLEYGLHDHVADLQRVARQYGVPFIDMDTPQLGYMDDWALFADEDHMDTCAGTVLLQGAIGEGVRQFRETGELLPAVPRARIATLQAARLGQCG